MTDRVLLELREISLHYPADSTIMARAVAALRRARLPQLRALDQVSLSLLQGEVLALVGESGSGKSTLGRIAVGMQAASAGSRYWRGQRMPDGARELALQMVFQDAHAALNPRQTVLEAIGEAPRCHGMVGAAEQVAYVAHGMAKVGLDPALMRRLPHQLSGGQRARVGIARALAVRPEFLVCDEAIASLDVSVQAQVLKLFMQLRQELGLTYLFISHNLGVVEHFSDRTAVLYLGRIVELAPTRTLFAQALHPYTQALLAATPRLHAGKIEFSPPAGEIASPLAAPSGCHFHPRCPRATARCREQAPALHEAAPQQHVACHYPDAA
ncbi:MAG: ABC transporter ATP-binding protein [Burkholderiaceae bacterium]|nr:ABC transporter ATP-binding protein [Burkholderiaceae bacterium]